MKIKKFNEDINFNDEDWEEQDDSDLKMFYFNPNGYGEEFMVCSNSKETALERVKKYLYDEIGSDPPYSNYRKEEYDTWKKATVNNLPHGVTIDEYPPGKVLRSEIA